MIKFHQRVVHSFGILRLMVSTHLFFCRTKTSRLDSLDSLKKILFHQFHGQPSDENWSFLVRLFSCWTKVSGLRPHDSKTMDNPLMKIDHSLFICSPVELKCRDPRPQDSKTMNNPPVKIDHSPSDRSSGRACSSVLLLNWNVGTPDPKIQKPWTTLWWKLIIPCSSVLLLN